MAGADSTACVRASQQSIPRAPHQRVPQLHAQAAKADECLMVLNVVERLPIISQGVLDGLSRTERASRGLCPATQGPAPADRGTRGARRASQGLFGVLIQVDC